MRTAPWVRFGSGVATSNLLIGLIAMRRVVRSAPGVRTGNKRKKESELSDHG